MFTCPRCSFITCRKGNMKAHLDRKYPCTPIDTEHDVSLEEFKAQINKPKEVLFTCDKCKKGFASELGIKIHKCPYMTEHSEMLNQYRIKLMEKQIELIQKKINMYKGADKTAQQTSLPTIL